MVAGWSESGTGTGYTQDPTMLIELKSYSIGLFRKGALNTADELGPPVLRRYRLHECDCAFQVSLGFIRHGPRRAPARWN